MLSRTKAGTGQGCRAASSRRRASDAGGGEQPGCWWDPAAGEHPGSRSQPPYPGCGSG